MRPDVTDIKGLLEELRGYLVRYNGHNLVSGIDETLDRLDQNPPLLDEARSIYRTAYQSKNQLADFHVEPRESTNWVTLNKRIGAIMVDISKMLKT